MSKYTKKQNNYYQIKNQFIYAINSNNTKDIEKILNYSTFIKNNSVLCLSEARERPEMLKYFLKNGANINAHIRKTGNSALHLATYSDDFQSVKLLIENNADANITNNNNITPFFIACKNSSYEIAKYLSTLDNIDLHKKSITGLAPIHIVCENGDIKLLDLFLNKTDLDEVLYIRKIHSPSGLVALLDILTGNTPLHLAVSNNQFLTAQKLLNHKCDPNRLNSLQASPLHTSTFNKSLKIAKLLIKHKAEINIQNIHGTTPIQIAMEKCDFKMIKLFLENKAQIEAHSLDGHCPLLIPIKHGILDIVKLVFQFTNNLNFQDKNNKTYLHIAIENNQIEVVNFLIQKNANINLTDYNGDNCLHYSHGNLALFKLFHQNGLELSANNNLNDNPIHYAARNNRIEVIDFMIKNKININLQDNYGNSALSIASSENFYELVKLLVSNKACVNAINKDNYTPLYFVINNEYQNNNTLEVVKFLIKNGAEVTSYYTSRNPTINHFLNLGRFTSILFDEATDANAVKELYQANGLAICDNLDEKYYKNREDNIKFIIELVKSKIYKADTIKKIQQYSKALVKNCEVFGAEDCISANCQFTFKFASIPLKILAFLSFHKYKSENPSITINPQVLTKIKTLYTLKEFLNPNFDLFKPIFEEFWPKEITVTGNDQNENLDV